LLVALTQNPQLAVAYVAAVHAEGLQQQIAMQERFRAEVTKALGQNSQHVNNLIGEAVKQLGSVWAKHEEAKRPQVIAGSTAVQIPGAQLPEPKSDSPKDLPT
jgi:hypothetical protein